MAESPSGPAAESPLASDAAIGAIDDAPTPSRRREAFRALRHRNFRLFFAGQLISLVGTWMHSVAQGWLVLRLSNSPFMLGVVTFARFSPILLITLFAGVIVDHVDRR